MIGAIIFSIIYIIYMTIKEGSPTGKAVAWTIVGIFGFIIMLADAGVDSDGLGSAFWVLVVIAIVVGIVIFFSKLTSSNEKPRPISPSPSSQPSRTEPVDPEAKSAGDSTLPKREGITANSKQTPTNVVCRTSQSTQLQMEKNQIDHDIDVVEKRLNEFLDKYRAT